MNATELKRLTTLGEDSSRQFKEDVRNADSLAAEMGILGKTGTDTLFILPKSESVPVFRSILVFFIRGINYVSLH